MKGLIFDLKEFSVHDGPGVRQTVFMKGCPLRCNWCHNPEGWQMRPELLVSEQDCISCGTCEAVCVHETCIACGACVETCPVRARIIAGEWLNSDELADRLNKNADIYRGMDGGVTFSGGEPLMQADFVFEVISHLTETHTVLETSGYTQEQIFRQAMSLFDLIMMDIKLVDTVAHKRFTGKDNDLILASLNHLVRGNTPFIIRIPLIPGVTDTESNLAAAAQLLTGAKSLQYVELLPYNRLAGAKYSQLGLEYQADFDEEQTVALRHEVFQQFGIESRTR